MTDQRTPDDGLPYAAPLPAVVEPESMSRKPPRQVRITAYLMLANAAVALLSVVAALTTPMEDYRATIASAYPTYTVDEVAKLAGDLRTFHAVVGAVLLLANVGLSLAVRRGFNWARVATLLLTGMSLIVTVAGGAEGGSAGALFRLLNVGIDVGIIALLATRGGRAFFRRARPGRDSRTF